MRPSIRIQRQTEDLSAHNGVFISHSSHDESFHTVSGHLEENKIGFLSDRLIEAGNSNYVDFIKELLRNASGGVVLLSKEAFHSPWVLYEIGMLEGMGKTIMLYCQDEKAEAMQDIPVMLRKYPVISDLSVLIEEVSEYTVFGTLFEYETADFGMNSFKKGTIGNVENIRLSVKIDSDKAIDADAIRFGYILLRLAKYGEIRSSTEKCLVTRDDRNEEVCVLNEDRNIRCGFLAGVDCVESPETVILNKILYHSTFVQNEFEYIIPFHIKYGLTFKCFIDVKDTSIKNSVVNALIHSGMEDVSYSDSGEDQRIYFLLPQVREIGLFQVEAPDSGNIINNFICPGCLIE